MQTDTQVLYVRLKWHDVATNEGQERIAPLPVTLGCASDNTIVLKSQLVSREHAVLTAGPGGIILQDRKSSHGTFVGQERVTQMVLYDGNCFQIGPFHFSMTEMPTPLPQATTTIQTSAVGQESPEILTSTPSLVGIPNGAQTSTLLFSHVSDAPLPLTPVAPLEESPLHAIFRQSIVPLSEMSRCQESLRETTYLTIGGGIGSFAWVDHLRICGVPPEQIVALGPEPTPTGRYQRLTRNAMDREARRIDWGRMWRNGWAQALRKTDDGRYIVAYSGINQPGEREQQFVVARYVHLAMGYPHIRLLADLQDYRQRTQDGKQVVHAYEEHEHIYDHLLEHGGVVIVRGRGIVASQVIQRLYEVRARNQKKDVMILHVHRSPVPLGHQDGRAWRQVKNHVELQPFNWPKACWSGPLRIRLEQANDQQRDQMLNDWGGTTTADRTYWQRIAREGLQEGWYQIHFGQTRCLDRTARGQLISHLSTGRPGQPEVSLTADFIIDCTGLDGGLDRNPLLKDMGGCYQLRRNPKGRLRVANDFEVEGMSNGPGRVYASGSTTLGGPHAAADSFLGLQYAALRSVEALEALHAPWLRRLTPLRSFMQWTHWVRGVRP